MVQILPQEPRLSELLGSSFGQGIGQGMSTGMQQYQKMQVQQIGQLRKQMAATNKAIANASKDLPNYIKTHFPEYNSPDDLVGIEKLYTDILKSNPGVSVDEARDQAAQLYKQQNPYTPDASLLSKAGDSSKGLLRIAGGGLASLLSAPSKGIGGLLSMLGSLGSEGQPGEFKGMGSRALKEAGQWTSETGRIGEEAIKSKIEEMLGKPYGTSEEAIGDFVNTVASIYGSGPFKGAAVPAVAGAGMGTLGKLMGVSPGQQGALEATGSLGTMIRDPAKALSSGWGGIKKLLGFGEEAAPLAEEMSQIQQTAEKMPQPQAQEALIPEVLPEKPIKVTEFTPEMQETKLRLDRMAPEERIFQVKSQEKLLQKELSLFPAYIEEIAADNAYLADKASKILGPRALATRAEKMKISEATLPKVQENYTASIARVRAIEEEMSRNPKNVEQLRSLYDAAKRNLTDSEYLLKQTINNAATGESRVGLESMREAAQKKTIDISEKIANGEEIKFGKADYNPEMIDRAKDLGRRKLKPGLREGDFNTQVHDEYAKIYQQRLAQLDNEMAQLSEKPTLADLYKRQVIGKEREAIKKLIDHIDAETAIHRHKLGLRELQARQTLQKRMKALKPAQGKAKVAEAAKERLGYQERYKEAKTPEAKGKVIDEASEAVAKETGKPRESVKDALIELQRKTEKASEKAGTLGSGKSTGEVAKNAKKIGHNIISDFQALIKSKNLKDIWSNPLGRDIVIGIMIPAIGAIGEEMGHTVPSTSIISALMGSGTVRGRGSRFLVSFFVKGAINKWRKENYKSALKSHDRKKVIEMDKSYSAKVKKEAKEELRGV